MCTAPQFLARLAYGQDTSTTTPLSSSKASSVTTGHGSYDSRDGEKNRLRCLRKSAFWLVRSAHTSSSRPAEWRYAGVPGDRGPAGRLPELPRGEGRAVGFSVREPFLHRAVCLLCGAAMPGEHDQGCGPGAEPRLAH